MALWKYFKREVNTLLQSPTGSLSKVISKDGIVAANKEVQRMMDSINDGTLLKRGPYEHFDNEEIVQIDHPSRENPRHARATSVDQAICCVPVTLKFSAKFFL